LSSLNESKSKFVQFGVVFGCERTHHRSRPFVDEIFPLAKSLSTLTNVSLFFDLSSPNNIAFPGAQSKAFKLGDSKLKFPAPELLA